MQLRAQHPQLPARDALEEALAATGGLSVAISDDVCDYAAGDQIACEEACARETCDPVQDRCDPALVKGACAGDCEGTCIMDGGSVLCEGACDGACPEVCMPHTRTCAIPPLEPGGFHRVIVEGGPVFTFTGGTFETVCSDGG